jgi:hypothetical protein
MKAWIYLFLASSIAAGGFYAGYKFAKPEKTVQTIDVKKSDTTSEVIKKIDYNNKSEMIKTIESPIEFDRKYLPNKNGSIDVFVFATDGTKSSKFTDNITPSYNKDYTTEIVIGMGAVLLAVFATIYIEKKASGVKQSQNPYFTRRF